MFDFSDAKEEITWYSLTAAAKFLGKNWGRNKLYKYLREKGYLEIDNRISVQFDSGNLFKSEKIAIVGKTTVVSLVRKVKISDKGLLLIKTELQNEIAE